MRKLLTWGALPLMVLTAPGAIAPAAAGDPDARVISEGFRYLPGDDAFPVPTLSVPEGGSLEYTNLERFLFPTPHSVTDARCYDDPSIPACEPRFDSGLISSPVTVDVAGVSALDPGAYPFYCTLHPEMRGTLVVQGA